MDVSSSPHVEYPATFSAELIEHCRQGCVPPDVFADARLQWAAERRRRYVRVNPRCADYVRDVGVEGVLRLEGLSRGPPESSPLSTEERQLRGEVQSYLSETPTKLDALLSSSSPLPTKEHIIAAVPAALLLRLGVTGLTGLPLPSVQSVSWLPPSVLTFPWSFAMGSSRLFRSGLLIAMDAASIAAVVALQPRQGERVLDLCCAPGMKLGLLADAVAGTEAQAGASGDGLAVGVDVSLPRLYMARSILKKQQCGSSDSTPSPTSSSAANASLPVCVFVGDGRSFTVPGAMASMDTSPAAAVDVGTGLSARERRRLQRWPANDAKRPRSDSTTRQHSGASSDDPSGVHVVYAPERARASLRTWQQEKDFGLFDRVLVDAECSHDGSMAHIQLEDETGKKSDGGEEEDDGTTPMTPSPPTPAIEKGRGLTNVYRMHHLNLDGSSAQTGAAVRAASSLADLQSELLYNGYQLLKPGGTLVYSTCSYAFTQDELVVQRVIERLNQTTEHAARTARVTAVLVPAFSRTYNASSQESGEGECAADKIAPCVRIDSCETEDDLQRQLDAHAGDYGVVDEGMRRYFPQDAPSLALAPVGSRFWPRTFSCSFLYVAKIWKRVDAVERTEE